MRLIREGIERDDMCFVNTSQILVFKAITLLHMAASGLSLRHNGNSDEHCAGQKICVLKSRA